VDLILQIDQKVPDQVWSDPVRLRQILYNLLGNAIKFSGQLKGKRGKVEVVVVPMTSNDGRTGMEFIIRDNGIGIDKDNLLRLFEEFNQGDSSTKRRYGGTGLGLAICDRLVKLMKGDIKVTSMLGEGSEFRVFLPLRSVNDAGETLAQATPLQNLDCVMVGSNESSDKIAYTLERAGARIHREVSLSSAMESCRKNPKWVLVYSLAADSMPTHQGNQDVLNEARLSSVIILPGLGLKVRTQNLELMISEPSIARRETLLRAVSIAAGRVTVENLEGTVEMLDPASSGCGNKLKSTEGSAARILVAEDDPINQRVIGYQLGLLGYNVDVANDGISAFGMWSEKEYDMVLSDLHMPDMDGYGLVRAIRQEESQHQLERTPVVFITADVLTARAWERGESDVDGYVSKPISLDELRDTLTTVLAQNQAMNSDRKDSLYSDMMDKNKPQIFDLDILYNVVGRDPGPIREFLFLFKGSARDHLEKIHQSLAMEDGSALGNTAHQLKSSARSIGAMRVAEICEEIEAKSQSEDLPEWLELVLRLERETKQLNKIIDQFIGQ
jgi:signal transduction histidine kinase